MLAFMSRWVVPQDKRQDGKASAVEFFGESGEKCREIDQHIFEFEHSLEF